jgi:hypothetical protein
MTTTFKIGDTVRIGWTYGKVLWVVIRGEHNDYVRVESLNPESLKAMGEQHQRWVKKSSVMGTA